MNENKTIIHKRNQVQKITITIITIYYSAHNYYISIFQFWNLPRGPPLGGPLLESERHWANVDWTVLDIKLVGTVLGVVLKGMIIRERH